MSRRLEIDEQLFASLETASEAKGIAVRDFIEQTLRAAAPMTAPGIFTQRAHDFGAHLESPWTVLAEIEGEAYAALPKK